MNRHPISKDRQEMVLQQKAKTVYIRGFLKQPLGCLVYSVEHSDEGYQVRYALSTHNPKDKFDQRLARYIAVGRWAKNPTLTDIDPSKEIRFQLNEILLKDPKTPLRVKKEIMAFDDNINMWLNLPGHEKVSQMLKRMKDKNESK